MSLPPARPDAQPTKSRPGFKQFPGTYSLIAITLAFFMGQFLSIEFFQIDWLLELGAKSRPEILAGEIWRFVTPVFLHLSIPHVFINMYSLYAIGPAVERFFGTARFVAVYLLCGIAGVVLSLAFSPYRSAGASGAIFGLLGSLGAFLYLHRDLFGRFGRQQLRQIVFVALLNLGFGLVVDGIDNWGHLGGLLAGAALTLFLGPRYEVTWASVDDGRLVDRRPWSATRVLFFAASGFLSALALVVIFFLAGT
ncbi:MAG: rhomboid family intramembrane serine protease [Anaerolineales bacterium]